MNFSKLHNTCCGGCKNGQIALKCISSILELHVITHVKGYFSGTISFVKILSKVKRYVCNFEIFYYSKIEWTIKLYGPISMKF